MLGRRQQLGDREHQAAIADQHGHGRLGPGELGADRTRQRGAERQEARGVVPAARAVSGPGEGRRVADLAGIGEEVAVGGQGLAQRGEQAEVGPLGRREAFLYRLPGACHDLGPAGHGRSVRERVRQGLERHRGVAEHRHVGRVEVVQLARIDVDPDQPAAERQPVDIAVGFGKLGADGEDDVRLGDADRGPARAGSRPRGRAGGCRARCPCRRSR